MGLLPLQGHKMLRDIKNTKFGRIKSQSPIKARDLLPRSHEELIYLHDIISSHDDEKKENDINYEISSQSFDICQLGKKSLTTYLKEEINSSLVTNPFQLYRFAAFL